MLTIRLPMEMEERLKNLSLETGRTKTYYVKEALNRYLEEMEDIYLAQRVVERIRSGKEKVLTSEELEKALGMGN